MGQRPGKTRLMWILGLGFFMPIYPHLARKEEMRAMKNITERNGQGIFYLLLAGMIMWVMTAYPCVSDAAGSGLFSKLLGGGGSGLSSLFSGMTGGGSGSSLSSLLGGSSSSGGDKSQSFLYKKAETCPFRQMYISGAAKEGSMTYEIGKSVDELYKSMGGTSTEITESDCEICNVLAGALGGESYDQYQQQLAQGKTTTTANTAGVTVYTAPGCGYCDQVKQLLQSKGVLYKEIDVTKDTLAAGEMVAKTGQTGVPVTVINGKYVVGYKPEEIEKLLGTSTPSGQTSTQKTAAPAQKAATTQKSAQKASTGSGSGSSLSSLLGGGSGGSLSSLMGGGGSGMMSGMLGGGGSSGSGGGMLGGLMGGGSSSSSSSGGVEHVAFRSQCVLDNGDEKTLNMHMWYPTEKQGPYPLVVFAHGNLMGSPTQCPYLTGGLAANGYVVCATTHSNSMSFASKPKGQDTAPGHLGLPLEIKGEIDEMLRMNADSGSEICGLIDESNIGVEGHSHGGWSSEVVCGAAPDELYADKRVKAGFFLEPANSYGYSGTPMAKGASANMHTASMWFFGTLDELVRPRTNKFPYDTAPAPKYCAVVSGMDHFMVAMGSSGHNATLGEYALAFFNRYLKSDTSADQLLQTKHRSFSSYEYELGEGDSGNAAGSQGNGNVWEEEPAYGSEQEKINEWLKKITEGQKEPAESTEPEENWEETPAYGPEEDSVGVWEETPAYSVQPEEPEDASSDDPVNFGDLLGTTNNTGSGDGTTTEESTETNGSVVCEDGVCYIVDSDSQAGSTQTTQSLAQIAQEILQLVNQHRASKGLTALKMDAALTNLAVEHSEDMAETGQGPKHNGSAERFQTIRSTLGGYGGAVAENCYSSFGSSDNIAETAVARWLGSSGHRANIENGKFTLTGIGVARSAQGEYYFTQIFFEE